MKMKGLEKLVFGLFDEKEERENFLSTLSNPLPPSLALLWLKQKPSLLPFPMEPFLFPEIDFVSLVSSDVKPGKNPLHDQGAYYCLDASSVFAASVLTAISKQVKIIIDGCASPGGKALFAWKYFKPQFLLTNEVIKSRLMALMSNLKRCGITPCAVSSFDPKILANHFESMADLVVADVPCSGQSLIVKGKRVPGCFNPLVVKKNFLRQRRVISELSRLVVPGGYLAYMTCTFSREENEGIIEWFLKHNSTFHPVEVSLLKNYQSHLTPLPCYRLWPHHHSGAGAFTCLLQKAGEAIEDVSRLAVFKDLKYPWSFF